MRTLQMGDRIGVELCGLPGGGEPVSTFELKSSLGNSMMRLDRWYATTDRVKVVRGMNG